MFLGASLAKVALGDVNFKKTKPDFSGLTSWISCKKIIPEKLEKTFQLSIRHDEASTSALKNVLS